MSRINSALFIHEEEIHSLFSILGEKENDLSYSLGYVLSQSPRLIKEIIKEVHKNVRFSNALVKLQESGKDNGFTDFEITLDNEYYFVIEAKKGWILPSLKQLKRYSPRFKQYKSSKRMFILMTDCSQEYFKAEYRDSIYKTPIKHISWSHIIEIIDRTLSMSSNKEKFLLNQLKDYLAELVIMENQESNWVYVLSLANSTPSWSELSWKDVVYKADHYFYPQGKNWPKIPPNYIAFRYDGKLQSIHHVKKYEVVQDVHKYIPEIRRGKLKKHFLLWLGEGFQPRKELPNGKIWSNGRLWCMLDTLFTSKTVKEACEISKKRLK